MVSATKLSIGMDDSLISDQLQEIKSREEYPPQSFAQAFITSPAKSKVIGLAMGSVPGHAGKYCLGLLDGILKELVDMLLNNPTAFGLKSNDEVEAAVIRNVETEFTLARGLLAREFQMTNEGKGKFEAMVALDEGKGEIVKALRRRIRLQVTKNFLERTPPIQITNSQNVNIVLGSVNTSIQNLMAKGGPEEEAARLIDELVNIVKGLDVEHQKEKTDLLNLAKGLAREIENSQKIVIPAL